MHNLGIVSNILTIIGIGVAIGSRAFSWNDMWTLAGVMLVLLGIVKLIMVLIWTRVAHLDDDRHRPIESP